MLSDYKYFALFYLVLVLLDGFFLYSSYLRISAGCVHIYPFIGSLLYLKCMQHFLALLCHNSAIIICFTTFWVVSYFWKIHVFLHLLFLHEVHLKHRLINKCNDLCLWSLTFYIRIFGPDTLLCEQGGCSHRSVHFGSWGGHHIEVSW